jgi:hypothetical protein
MSTLACCVIGPDAANGSRRFSRSLFTCLLKQIVLHKVQCAPSHVGTGILTARARITLDTIDGFEGAGGLMPAPPRRLTAHRRQMSLRTAVGQLNPSRGAADKRLCRSYATRENAGTTGNVIENKGSRQKGRSKAVPLRTSATLRLSVRCLSFLSIVLPLRCGATQTRVARISRYNRKCL